MAIPDFQSLMLPVFRQFADGAEKTPSEIRGPVAGEFKLTADDLAVLLRSGRQSTFANRVAWSLGYLKQAKLLESPRHGVYRITRRGQELLGSTTARIDIPFLERYPEFLAFRTRASEIELKGGQATAAAVSQANVLTPDEEIRAGYARLRASLAAQLLERVKQASPAFFEYLVVEVLVAMGYGGSHEDAAQVVGKSGDGGIDGIIKQDRLGLDSIYVQAKRWENTVGRPTIQQFAGAMDGRHARKGVVVTTATFSPEAVEYAKSHPKTIVLIGGSQLAELMIEFGVDVSEEQTLKIKKLDEGHFADGVE